MYNFIECSVVWKNKKYNIRCCLKQEIDGKMIQKQKDEHRKRHFIKVCANKSLYYHINGKKLDMMWLMEKKHPL